MSDQQQQGASLGDPKSTTIHQSSETTIETEGPGALGGGDPGFVPSQETPENTSGKPSIVILGVYLLVIVIASIYLEGAMMVAETDKTKIDAKLGRTPTPTPTPVADPASTAGGPTPQQPASSTPVPSPTKASAANSSGSSSADGSNSNTTKKTPTPTPTPTPIDPNVVGASVPSDILVELPFLGPRELTADSYVFWVVVMSGLLGGAIKGISSFVGHLGLKNFATNWFWFYYTAPFSGAALAIIIYLVLRGGFYGSTFGKGLVLNVFAFAALAALSGLFAEQGMEKLKQVADVLLAELPPKVENAREIKEAKDARDKPQ